TTDPSETDAPPVCGDGVVEGDEACDDGPDNADDGACTTACAAAACGDGYVFSGVEECDDGGDNADDAACTSQCAAAYCGDGLVWSGAEECDDGDDVENGCTNACVAQRVVDIGVSHFHVCAILSGGKVKCWGANLYGYLGQGDTESRGDDPGEMGVDLPYVDLGAGAVALRIAAARGHTCVLLEGGAVKCWGLNNYAQLGAGHLEHLGDDPGEMGDNLAPVNLGDGVKAIDVAAGYDHACAITEGGKVKCWGHDFAGQLGYGGTPQACGNQKCRGAVPEDMGDNLPFVDLGAGQVAIALSAGQGSTCALLEGGDVKCWGVGQVAGQGTIDSIGNNPGEMGDNLPPIVLGGPAVELASGLVQHCVRLEGGGVKCWGIGIHGGLGTGATDTIGDEPGEMAALLPIDLGPGFSDTNIAAGRFSGCVVDQDGGLKCWGHNMHGQLGQGDALDRGDAPGEMGANLPRIKLFTDTW
ncbi:MAG: hypothetical protein KC636_09100, partial [Myxococcales bacterium]|nr:hypothetical protein [Myxococcales bacterium]